MLEKINGCMSLVSTLVSTDQLDPQVRFYGSDTIYS